MVTAYRNPKNKELSDWLLGLDKKGELPVLLVYEIANASEAAQREHFWTSFFRPLGCLLNIKTGDSQSPSIIEKRRAWMKTAKGEAWKKNIRDQHKAKQPSLLLWGHRQHFKNLRSAGSKKRWKQVRCIETDEVFESLGAAARSVSKSWNALEEAIRRNYRCGGKHWEYALKPKQLTKV
jgi:hypothetical protein